MHNTVLSATLLSILTASTSAHTIFQELYVNGVSKGHLTGIRVPDTNSPITDVTSNDVICNGGINPYHQPMPQDIITVAAGATVTTEWHHGLNGADPNDGDDPIATSHKGPVISYLASVSNATQTDVTSLKWFKIYEDGLNASDQSWGVDRMIAQDGKVTFTIPSCIPAGQYLLRHEIIALHGASTYPGAQLYMECAQLQITGGGNVTPSSTVSFPGAYAGTDPGITVNIYYPPLTQYTIPGPPVFTCSGSGSGSSTSTSTTSTTATTTKASTTTTSASATPTSTATGTVAQYGQCGGIGWTGATVCVSPYTCNKINDYYSQCL